jgi:hypothetical protein
VGRNLHGLVQSVGVSLLPIPAQERLEVDVAQIADRDRWPFRAAPRFTQGCTATSPTALSSLGLSAPLDHLSTMSSCPDLPCPAARPGPRGWGLGASVWDFGWENSEFH